MNFQVVGSGLNCVCVCACVFCRSSTGSEDEVTENARQAYGRHGREGGAAGPGSLERRLHELEMVRPISNII